MSMLTHSLDPRMSRAYAIIEAPSVLGLKPTGVELLPEFLLANGLAENVGARRAARLEPPDYDPVRDVATQTLNASAIASYTRELANLVERVLSEGDCPFILGGDCSIVLGPTLALRRRGRFGLLFIDGHADFYQPEVNPNGEAASMDLAFATGYGPPQLTNLEGLSPFVQSADVVAYGFRDQEEQAEYGSQPLPADMLALDLHAVRRLGTERAIRMAVERLTRPELDGFFVHVDADCLNDADMPAVDYRMPDGLTCDELELSLRVALESAAVAGLEVAIYNPKLDPGGVAGRKLTQLLVRALGKRAPGAPASVFR